MADSVKNVTFRFKADTSQLQRVIDDLNKSIANAQKTLSNIKLTVNNAEAKAAINALGGEYRKLIGADNEYKKQTIAAAKQIRKENEAAAKEITKQKQAEYKKLIAADNEYVRQARANAQRIAQENAKIRKEEDRQLAKALAGANIRRRASQPEAAPQIQKGTGFLDTLQGGLAAFGIVATTDAIVDLGKSTIQASIDFENLTASFRALIGDKERADKAIADIQQFALETPFDVTKIAAAGKTLLGYGINVEDLIPTLRQLGDVSAASGGDIQRVALAFGQVSAKGKLQGEEIRQLVNVGFNPLQEISRKTGESMAALSKRVEEGKVSFEEVAEAFRVATSEGGRFFNLAATLNQTFGGQLQKLSEQINLFKIEIGGIAAEELRPLVEDLIIFFENLAKGAKEIRNNALQLAAWKAAIAFLISLLFRSANAWVRNTFTIANFNKILLATRASLLNVNKTIQFSTLLINTNTASTKGAAVAYGVWNTAIRIVAASTNILANAVRGLFAIIKSNPIGILIGAYTLLNGLIERNRQLTVDERNEREGILDAEAQSRKSSEELTQTIKEREKDIAEQFGAVIKAAKDLQITNSKVQAAIIKDLEDEYGIRLDVLRSIKDTNKAVKILEEARTRVQQREKFKADVEAASRETKQFQKNNDAITKQLNVQKDIVKQKEIEVKLREAAQPTGTDFLNLPKALKDIKALKDARTELEDAQLELQRYKNLIVENDTALASWQEKLVFAKNALIAIGDIEFLSNLEAGNQRIADTVDLLQKLINLVNKFQDQYDDAILKGKELKVDLLPEDTEEQQLQKAFEKLTLEREKQRKSREEDLAELQNEVAEVRRVGQEKLEQAKKDGKDASALQAVVAEANKKAKELEELGLQRITKKYNALDENLLISHNQKLFDIAQFWIDRNKQNLEDTRKEETEEYLRQLQRREEGLQGIQSDIEERFVKTPPGGAKELRQRFKDITAALQDNLQEQLQIRKANRVLEFVGEKEDARKRYELLIGNITETGEERTKKEARYWQQYLDEINLRQTKFDNDITEMEQETADKQFDIGKANAERLKQLEKERKLAIIDAIQETIDFSVQAAQQIIDIEAQKNDALIQLQEERVEKAREIADKGNAALLEAEEQRLNELQKKRAKFVRAQQALILAQTIAESTLAIARAAVDGGGWLSAITIAATVAALAAGFASARAQSTAAIGGFAEGGWTGKGGKYEPAGVVHREEFVVKKGPAEKYRPLLEQMNRGRDPLLAKGMGQQVIMINNVGVEERLARIEKAITGQDRMQLTIDESGIHGIVSHYQWKNQRIRNKTR